MIAGSNLEKDFSIIAPPRRSIISTKFLIAETLRMKLNLSHNYAQRKGEIEDLVGQNLHIPSCASYGKIYACTHSEQAFVRPIFNNCWPMLLYIMF
uniref:Uncharacterized protein n=1 Tax=Octopus bimaculoides TaxID=37653 RepID=A0A0L8HXI5_OCTBM